MTGRPLVNIADLTLERDARGSLYESSEAPFAALIGLRGLGVRYCEVPAGKSACPFHNHHVEDEMFIVLDGEGTYRFGAERYPFKAGDVLGAPAGGHDTAHQIINTGASTLRYLGVSTVATTEVCEYPDSGKFLVKSAAGAWSAERHPHPAKGARVHHIGRPGEHDLDYWDGEAGS